MKTKITITLEVETDDPDGFERAIDDMLDAGIVQDLVHEWVHDRDVDGEISVAYCAQTDDDPEPS